MWSKIKLSQTPINKINKINTVSGKEKCRKQRILSVQFAFKMIRQMLLCLAFTNFTESVLQNGSKECKIALCAELCVQKRI